MSEEYYYRYATEEDVDLIFNWANEKAVRQNSFNSAEIKYEDHVKWYKNLLADKEHNDQLILMHGDVPVGQCRLRYEGESVEIGLSVDKDHRGTGAGNALIDCICKWVKENRPEIKTIVGRIKPENIASQKAVLRAGFVETYVNYEYHL